MSERKAQFERRSKETEMKAALNIDGSGNAKIRTHIGFMDHMLELFVFHGLFDLDLNVEKADLEIDIHHTNEDIGIVLGKTFKRALEDSGYEGIRRFGHGAAPMEATVGWTVVDLSGRGYFRLNIPEDIDRKRVADQEGYSFAYLEHFLESFAHNLGATISVTIQNVSDDLHTNVESVFKSLGLALKDAVSVDPRRKGVPSTKGIID
jgi:imidazoleglycerol-phosphate dehydratase